MKKGEERLYRMAHYDSLTGLANRRHFLDLLSRALKSARRSRETLAVMFIDLDSFKPVNDNFGHRAGDQLLREVARRLSTCVRETDTVARMGGDEFTVLLSDVQTEDNAAAIARKMLQRIAEPTVLDRRDVSITSSIGIALMGDDSSDAETLVRNADTAMYRVKERGKNGFQFFSTAMNNRADEKLAFQSRVRHGLDAREFTVYYQPRIELVSGRVVSLEALVRWQNPEKGLLVADQFVPQVEGTDHICAIGELVLRAVCRQGSIWRAHGLQLVPLVVNTSARQLGRPDFLPMVQAILGDSWLPPGRLEFELSERAVSEGDSESRAKLQRLKAMGVLLTLDDFCTEHSSLADVRQLPFDRLTINRSLVNDLVDNSVNREIVAAIVAMGRSLKLDVVCKGVETQKQARLLLEIGCPSVQGYYYGRPMPPESIWGVLEKGVLPVETFAP